jgi:SAM-dependent methyltransferase
MTPSGLQYGSLEWFQSEYGKVSDDPWGLGWRPSQALRYQRTIQLLARIDEPIHRAVDIGCATGDFSYVLSRFLGDRGQLLAVDFVDAALQRARERYPAIDFTSKSIAALGDGYRGVFDVATCLEVLYYVPDTERRAALQSVKRSLRARGFALFSSLIAPPPHFAADDFVNLIGDEFEIVHRDVLHLRAVSAIEKAGIRIGRYLRAVKRSRTGAVNDGRWARLPLEWVAPIESCSQLVPFTASHVLVLARAVD